MYSIMLARVQEKKRGMESHRTGKGKIFVSAGLYTGPGRCQNTGKRKSKGDNGFSDGGERGKR